MKSFSQLGQDIDVLKFYDFKTNGTFLEIGANDGVYLSNTYLLEKQYGWKGICVEPIPDVFQTLQKNRTAICIERAILDRSDGEIEFVIQSNSLLSGISEHIIDIYKKDIKNSTSIMVKTLTIDDLIVQNNFVHTIDYMSLDTEGTEFEILKTIDYTKYIFGVIHLEHNFQEKRRTDIRNLLTQNSYVFAKQNNWDDYYVHSSLEHLIPRFDNYVSLGPPKQKYIWSRR